MDREVRSEETYARLFGAADLVVSDTDPELNSIIHRFLFGDIFHTGDLDDRMRELITIVVLTTMQTIPQLRAHVSAALNVGLSPVEIREAVYQCAPLIGFPRTLNAVTAMNEVFCERGIALPLPSQATVAGPERFEAGHDIQRPLFGDEVRNTLSGLPDGSGAALAHIYTEHCFGDFYTRNGLDLRTRELLVLCILASHSSSDTQLKSHSLANLKIGNTIARQVAAVTHCFPFIGFTRVSIAVRAIKVIDDMSD